jgi:succinate dehydrogenase / fumarate reductase cytochrome b subunit
MTDTNQAKRPLSPHLTIYRPQFTSVLSILHRITGIALLLAVILIVIWFVAVALGPYYFNLIETVFDHILVRLMLVSATWAIWYHMCTGVRHLIWDAGYLLEIKWINPTAYVVLFSSFVLTALTVYISWIG